MTKPLQARRFRMVSERTNVLIAVCIIAGVGLYVWSEATSGMLKSILSGIASAVLALGLVTFASDFILKTAFTEDVLQISNLKHEIYNSGILGVTEESDMKWPDLLDATRKIEVVTLRPGRWHSNVWPHIRKAAKNRTVNIEVIFLDPDSEAAGQMALRLGQAKHSYCDEISRVARDVEQEWKREKRDDTRKDPSTLQISLTKNMPNHSLVRVDGQTCLIAEPVTAMSGSQSTMCLTFREMSGESFTRSWLSTGLQDIQENLGAPLYTDKSIEDPGADSGRESS